MPADTAIDVLFHTLPWQDKNGQQQVKFDRKASVDQHEVKFARKASLVIKRSRSMKNSQEFRFDCRIYSALLLGSSAMLL